MKCVYIMMDDNFNKSQDSASTHESYSSAFAGCWSAIIEGCDIKQGDGTGLQKKLYEKKWLRVSLTINGT